VFHAVVVVVVVVSTKN